jgi:hypothetical protein
MFQGTFDVAAKRWTVTDTRSINADQYDALETAYYWLKKRNAASSICEKCKLIEARIEALQASVW